MADMHTPLADREIHVGKHPAGWHGFITIEGLPFPISIVTHATDLTFDDTQERIRAADELVKRWNRRAPSQGAETIKALREEAARQKQRGDNHWETLRSIRQIAKDGDCERIVQWVNDAGTGYVENVETTLAKAMDRAASAEKALIAARTVILEDRDAMFDSVTVAGDASTMDEIDRPHVERLDAIMSVIDAALAGSAS